MLKQLNLADMLIIVITCIIFNGVITLIDQLIYSSLCLLWLLVIYIYSTRNFSKIIINVCHIMLLIFISIYMFMMIELFPIESIIYRPLIKYTEYFPMIIGLYYLLKYNDYKKYIVSKILFAIVYIFLVIAVVYFYTSNNPVLIRDMVSGTAIVHGIGGNPYQFCYAVDMISLCIIYDLLNNKVENIYKFIYKGCFVLLACILTIISDSSTTIMIFSFCIGVAIINRILRIIYKGKMFYLFTFLAVATCVISVYIILPLVDISFFIENGIGGHFLTERLITVQKILEGASPEEAGSTWAVRIALRLISLNTFLDNPFWGIWGTQYEIPKSLVGGHCEIVDLLATFGLIGCFPMIMFLLLGFRKMYIKEYWFIGIYPLFVSFMNTIGGPATFFAFFLMAPLLIHTSNMNKQLKNK